MYRCIDVFACINVFSVLIFYVFNVFYFVGVPVLCRTDEQPINSALWKVCRVAYASAGRTFVVWYPGTVVTW